MLRYLFVFSLFSAQLLAQIDCDVTINFEQISSVQDRLQNFERDIENYINSQKWSTEDLDGEKIKCTMNIFFTGATDANTYQAQVFIGSSRPIFVGKYPSNRMTAMVGIFDDNWEFTYVNGQPLYRNESQYDPLTDFLDFYMYVILGYDYDSYEQMSGTEYFRKAFSICNTAPSGAKGWDRGTGSTYSKYNLLEEILNPSNRTFREGFYIYHFRGLDLLATRPEKGYENMIVLLQTIQKLKSTTNPRALLFKTFFDTKYGELAEVFKGYKDKSVFSLLAQIDQAHLSTYEEAAR